MENNLKTKSFKFAVRITKLYRFLVKERKEYVISKQLLRCGTSIGANVREAQNGESKLDFIHKLAISQKETDETLYWLELLKEADYLTESEYLSIYQDAIELPKIIRSIIISTKRNLENQISHNS